MSNRSHWHHAILVFVLIVLAAGILLPFVRSQPESLHQYFNGLKAWVRISFTFLLCVIFTGVMFKLLSPRVGHIAHVATHPPTWLAAAVAWLVVAVVDIFGGFAPDGYRASPWEWLGYGGGSLLLVGVYFGFWQEFVHSFSTVKNDDAPDTSTVTLQDIEDAPWDEIGEWLRSDAPAKYDFIGNEIVAERVSQLVSDGTRSIGIVGPFGAGKTSLVERITARLAGKETFSCRYFVSTHSSWGFETSASAIHEMLNSALSQLGKEIDTFQLDSLPESYRQTFSAGGDWFETISKLVLRSADPLEQFSHLSQLLRSIGGRLIFVVEDLDRNDTTNFEIQEVLAFLERIKVYPNLSFILTGGLSSSKHIDYAKLCDHIEYLRTIGPYHSFKLIERVSQRCRDQSVFPHFCFENGVNHVWNPDANILMRDYEEFSLPHAVASLLNTPRSLRHALSRTLTAWRTLHGEIDFDHLLSVNILRFGAPECFQFVMRHWERLRSAPLNPPAFGQEKVDEIRKALSEDWKRTTQNVEWNAAAASKVMEFILPGAEYWLSDSSQRGHFRSGRQCVFEERYWIRVVSESIEKNDVRDQEVIRDIQKWIASPGISSDLVTKLASSRQYGDVWVSLAANFFVKKPDQILLLCEQVIQRILAEHGSSASHESQGFIHTWHFASRQMLDPVDTRLWLESVISHAAFVSIEMINGLWRFYGAPGSHSIIRMEDAEPVRQHVLATLKRCVTDGQTLVAKLSPDTWATVYQLVFDVGDRAEGTLNDVASWAWLGPYILEAMRSGNVLAAKNCNVLLGARVSARDQLAIDTDVLDKFFGSNQAEVINLLDSMRDQFPSADHTLVKKCGRSSPQSFCYSCTD